MKQKRPCNYETRQSQTLTLRIPLNGNFVHYNDVGENKKYIAFSYQRRLVGTCCITHKRKHTYQNEILESIFASYIGFGLSFFILFQFLYLCELFDEQTNKTIFLDVLLQANDRLDILSVCTNDATLNCVYSGNYWLTPISTKHLLCGCI